MASRAEPDVAGEPAAARMISAKSGAKFRSRDLDDAQTTNHIGVLVEAAAYGGEVAILLDPLKLPDGGVIPAGSEMELVQRQANGTCTYRVTR